MAAESRQCPRCRNFDSLEPLADPANDTKWTVVGGQMFAVKQMQCRACGLSDLVERDVARVTRGAPEPLAGQMTAADGRMFVVHPISAPPIESGVTND